MPEAGVTLQVKSRLHQKLAYTLTAEASNNLDTRSLEPGEDFLSDVPGSDLIYRSTPRSALSSEDQNPVSERDVDIT
jgi:hypothetical protein